MRSRISFFNRTIFMKNITHFWPIWAIYSLFCIWSMPVYSFFSIRSVAGLRLTATEEAYEKVLYALNGMETSLNPWIIFLFSVCSAVAVFSYLYNSRNANMIHALPVCREELFVTNYLSGLLFMLVPQIVSFLLTVFVWFGSGITHLEYLLQWLGIVTGEAFFAYSMSVFCAMLTGNIVAAPIGFVVCNFLYKGLWSIWNLVRQALVYGYSGSAEVPYGAGLVPLDYLNSHIRIMYSNEIGMKLPTIEGLYALKWYALAAVVFVLFAFVLYRKRRLECAGDIVSVSEIKPVIRWVGAVLCAGLTSVLIQTSFFYEKVLFGDSLPVLLVCWIFGGVIAFFGIEMIMEKDFMIFSKKLLVESGVFAVLIVLFLGCMEKDLFQFEKRIPEAEDVLEIYVSGNYERYLTGQEEIQENIELQKQIIESQDEYQQFFKKYYGKEECNYIPLSMTYVLKNGKKQTWSYNLPTDEYYFQKEGSAQQELVRQESDSEQYMNYYFTEKHDNIKLQSGSYVDWIDKDYNFQNNEISLENAEKLLEAFQKDVYSGNYCIYPLGTREWEENTYVNTLTFCYIPPKGAHMIQYGMYETYVMNGKYEVEESNVSDGRYTEYASIILTKECRNTIAMLEEMGYIDEEHSLMTTKEYEAAYEEIEYY